MQSLINDLALLYSQVPSAAGSPIGVYANPSISGKGAGLQPSRLVVAQLDQLVRFYFKQALATSTTRAYEVAKKRYCMCLLCDHSIQPGTGDGGGTSALCSFPSRRKPLTHDNKVLFIRHTSFATSMRFGRPQGW